VTADRYQKSAGAGVRATARVCGAALGLVIFAAAVHAADPPHWSSTNMNIDCTSNCHTPHQAPGGGLTASAGNVNLCQSCHRSGGLAAVLPVDSADLAQPTLGSGRHHGFDVAAIHVGFGAQLPTDLQMSLRVMNGNVVCSTCHDQHRASSARGGSSRIGSATRTTALGSTGSVATGGTFTGAQGVWYLLAITVAGNQSTARFGYSKDNGTSWFPGSCTPGGVTSGCLTAGASVALDSGVTLAFGAGSFTVGERWQFSASWPFLRANLDSGDNGASDKFCRDCHRDWVMTHTDVRTYTGTVRSHPVGVALDANGLGYDRPVPLDGNGAAQGSAGRDANPTNDYRLDAGGRVQCLSCHGIHYADSNTTTVDLP